MRADGGARIPPAAAKPSAESAPAPTAAADAFVILLSGPEEELRALGRALVEERLVACVSVVPGAHSLYRWGGEVCEQEEALAVLKTTRGRLAAVEARVLELHSYEVAEFLALEVGKASVAYLQWLGRSVSPERDDDDQA